MALCLTRNNPVQMRSQMHDQKQEQKQKTGTRTHSFEFQKRSCKLPDVPVIKIERPLIKAPGAETILASGGWP
jgi:hypothetical protein